MKTCMFCLAFLLLSSEQPAVRQYATESALVAFRSETPLLTLVANNYFAVFQLDSRSGQFACEVPVEAFEFDLPAMKRYFNTHYLDSQNFPKAVLTGQLQDVRAVDFEKDGDYPVRAAGELTIRGVARQVQALGRVEVRKGQPTIFGTLDIALSDYGIPHPGKIADSLRLTLVARCGDSFR